MTSNLSHIDTARVEATVGRNSTPLPSNPTLHAPRGAGGGDGGGDGGGLGDGGGGDGLHNDPPPGAVRV
jgi:hypothetical protein